MQALPGAGSDGGDGSLTGAFFLDLVGDAGDLAFLLFLVDGFRTVLGEVTAPFPLCLFFVDELGASGDVDMSISGSPKSLSASTTFFLLRFLLRGSFSSVAAAVGATPLSVAKAGRLLEVSLDVAQPVSFAAPTYPASISRVVWIGLCLYTTFMASLLSENLMCIAPPQS